MTTQPPCTKCQGTGVGDRQAEEANPDMHPILSRSKGVCDRCGGSTYEPKPTRATNIASARAADG
jgi:hypothetical protein